MFDSPQSQESITIMLSMLDSHIVTRKYYKKISMLNSPQSRENIPKYK